MRKFEELEVWQSSKKLCIEIYQITKEIPTSEMYGLVSQLRRAAVSVPSNIAEGCSRSSNKEFARYLEIAIGSLFEMETQLIIAMELDFLGREKVPVLLEEIHALEAKTNAFIKSVKKFDHA